MLRFLMVLPEKDDEGRQLFIVRPGNIYGSVSILHSALIGCCNLRNEGSYIGYRVAVVARL